jgi:hypothetical protein
MSRVKPQHPDGAPIGMPQSLQTFDGGRLSRPIRAHKAEDLTSKHGKIDPFNGGVRATDGSTRTYHQDSAMLASLA